MAGSHGVLGKQPMASAGAVMRAPHVGHAHACTVSSPVNSLL